jgi:hypothetical protein
MHSRGNCFGNAVPHTRAGHQPGRRKRPSNTACSLLDEILAGQGVELYRYAVLRGLPQYQACSASELSSSQSIFQLFLRTARTCGFHDASSQALARRRLRAGLFQQR